MLYSFAMAGIYGCFRKFESWFIAIFVKGKVFESYIPKSKVMLVYKTLKFCRQS